MMMAPGNAASKAAITTAYKIELRDTDGIQFTSTLRQGRIVVLHTLTAAYNRNNYEANCAEVLRLGSSTLT